MNVIGELGDLIIRYQRGIEIAVLIILGVILVLWLVKNYGKHKVRRDLLDEISEKVSDINDTVHSVHKYQKILTTAVVGGETILTGEEQKSKVEQPESGSDSDNVDGPENIGEPEEPGFSFMSPNEKLNSIIPDLPKEPRPEKKIREDEQSVEANPQDMAPVNEQSVEANPQDMAPVNEQSVEANPQDMAPVNEQPLEAEPALAPSTVEIPEDAYPMNAMSEDTYPMDAMSEDAYPTNAVTEDIDAIDEIPEDAVPVDDDRDMMFDDEPSEKTEYLTGGVDYSGKSIFEIYDMMRQEERKVAPKKNNVKAESKAVPDQTQNAKPRKTVAAPTRKYNERDCAVDKHGNVYTAEMLAQQIY